MKSSSLQLTISLSTALSLLFVGCSNNRSSVRATEEVQAKDADASDSTEVFFGFVQRSGSDSSLSILILTQPDLNNPKAAQAIALGNRSGVYVFKSANQETMQQLRRVAGLSLAETQIVFSGKLHQNQGSPANVEIEEFAECGKEVGCEAGLKSLLSKKDEPKVPALVATGKDIQFREIKIDRMGGRLAAVGLFYASTAEDWAKVYEHRLNDILPLKMPNFDIDFSKEMVVGYQTGESAPKVTGIKIDKDRKAIFVMMDQKVSGPGCFFAGGLNSFSSTAVVIDASEFEGVKLGAPIIREVEAKCN
jgi:hypothetical protein